jgi:hypothetical protein
VAFYLWVCQAALAPNDERHLGAFSAEPLLGATIAIYEAESAGRVIASTIAAAEPAEGYAS